MDRASVRYWFASPALGALAVLAVGCANRVSAQPQRLPVAIAVEPAPPAGVRSLYEGPGSVVAAHTYRLAFEIGGRVARVTVDVGDRVGPGEALASLDGADFAEQLAMAQARAASADAQAERARNGARPQERAQADEAAAAAQAQLARALAAAELARANDARARELVASGDIPLQQADTTRTALTDAALQVAAARAQLASARENAALVASGPRDEDKRAALADAAAARANAAYAAATLAKTVLRAPAQAYVQAREVDPGDSVQPGSVAFVLTDAAPPDVIVAVPEAKLAGIGVGTPVTVRAGGAVAEAAARSVGGRVTRLEPAADPASRTVAVRVHAGGIALRPGAVVEVDFGPHRADGTSVAIGTLLSHDGAPAVEVYDPLRHTVRFAPVRVLASTAERATVAGIAPGTPVVVMGQHEAQPGDDVRTVDP
jgi:multidrug resistance efflux pump